MKTFKFACGFICAGEDLQFWGPALSLAYLFKSKVSEKIVASKTKQSIINFVFSVHNLKLYTIRSIFKVEKKIQNIEVYKKMKRLLIFYVISLILIKSQEKFVVLLKIIDFSPNNSLYTETDGNYFNSTGQKLAFFTH
jgi:hypothetical protein